MLTTKEFMEALAGAVSVVQLHKIIATADKPLLIVLGDSHHEPESQVGVEWHPLQKIFRYDEKDYSFDPKALSSHIDSLRSLILTLEEMGIDFRTLIIKDTWVLKRNKSPAI